MEEDKITLQDMKDMLNFINEIDELNEENMFDEAKESIEEAILLTRKDN